MSYRVQDPTDLAEIQRVADEQAAREQVDRENEEGDFRWLMSDKRGRRVVRRILLQAGLDESVFDQNYGVMARREGRREFGIALQRLIKRVCPARVWTMMLTENADDRSADDARNDTNS